MGIMNSVSTVSKFASVAIVFGWMVGLSSSLEAQFRPAQVQQLGAIRIAGAVAGNAQDEKPSTEIGFESGAVLKTDPNLEGILEKAERFREDGNYRVASKLWQAVLNQSGDSLYSSDGANYFSLVEQVESILASLPEDGLDAYRVLADAEAKEILASAPTRTDEVALNQIVRQYFVSSLGDEAAFDLGCIYLDRFDFTGARRMFEKIANSYPDPTISLEEVHTRIALCQSYLGDVKSAEASLVKADAIKPDTEQASLVRRSLGELNSSGPRMSVDSDWLMPMGNAKRYGVTVGVPDSMMEGDLKAVWQYYFEPQNKYIKAADTNGMMLTGTNASGESVLKTRQSMEERLIKAWKTKGWRPAGHLLLQDDRVYFKSGADLTVWNRDKVLASTEFNASQTVLTSAISWRSVWKNSFLIDEATQMMQMIRKSYGAYNRRGAGGAGAISLPEPSSEAEVQLFGDRIHQQMSIYDGKAYTIEGRRYTFEGKNRNNPKRVTPQWNATYRRSRTNVLTCYNSENGSLEWSLPRELAEDSDDAAVNAQEVIEDPKWIEGGGFMAAPIGFANMIIVPVNVGGSISVYALDPAQEGKTIWKSFLCDEPESGAVAWSAINLSIDGSDLFVNCGMGVIFVLDPATGLVRFAKRYKRIGKSDDFQRRNNWTVNRLNFQGWKSDEVIPYGRQMICLSSDTNVIEAFDRNSGKLIWKTDMSPLGYKIEYVLGVYDDVLYLAGPETLTAHDLKGTGMMIFGAEQAFEGKQSFGHGLLTPKGIYMPVEDSIYHFDLKAKIVEGEYLPNLLNKVQVDMGTEAPVGNLYSDGERFWVHGANRLYMLGSD